MRRVIRWGRSAYETDEQLADERNGALRLGLGWEHVLDRQARPALAGAEALVVTSGVRVTAEVLEMLSGDLVLTTTSGYDHIDVAAARARGITVARMPQARRDAVVDHSIGSMIWLMRRFHDMQAAACRGHWARGDLPGLAPVGLADATVGVVGLGVIGRKMVRVLHALGARVLGVDPRGGPPEVTMVSLEEALVRADVVTLHCALTDSSASLLDAAALASMRSHAIVVNTARGKVLDVRAAVEAVLGGRLGGLSVDVFPQEPWSELQAASDPRILMTPHAAGYTDDLGLRVATGVNEALSAWARGETIPYRVT